MNANLDRVVLFSAVLFGCLVVHGSAHGQQTEPKAHQVTVTLHKGSQEKEVKVIVTGTEVKAVVDQEEVPIERIVIKDAGTVNVLTETGKKIATVKVDAPTIGLPALLDVLKAVKKPTLGINLGPVGESLAEHLGISSDEAILVLGVTDGGAAERAGLVKHDIITAIDGESPVSRAKLTEVLEKKKQGDSLVLKIRRKGRASDVKVQLEEKDFKVGNDRTPLELYSRLNTQTTPYLVDPIIDMGTYDLFTQTLTPKNKANMNTLKTEDALTLLKSVEALGGDKETEALRGELKDLRKQLDRLQELLKEVREKKND